MTLFQVVSQNKKIVIMFLMTPFKPKGIYAWGLNFQDLAEKIQNILQINTAQLAHRNHLYRTCNIWWHFCDVSFHLLKLTKIKFSKTYFEAVNKRRYENTE